MEIRIGITQSGRELNFDSSESAEAVKRAIAQALDSGATHLTFHDTKGNTLIIPSNSIAYVEIGTEESRRVGFVA